MSNGRQVSGKLMITVTFCMHFICAVKKNEMAIIFFLYNLTNLPEIFVTNHGPIYDGRRCSAAYVQIIIIRNDVIEFSAW